MLVEVINTKKQYELSLQRFEEIFLAKSNTKVGKEAQLLALVIKDYEEKLKNVPTQTVDQEVQCNPQRQTDHTDHVLDHVLRCLKWEGTGVQQCSYLRLFQPGAHGEAGQALAPLHAVKPFNA